MIEVDGPARAYLRDSIGTAYFYEVFGIGQEGDTPADVIQAYANWRLAYEDPNMILVWRRRPQLEQMDIADMDSGWKITCRCVKIPLISAMGSMPMKPEGMQVRILNEVLREQMGTR